MLPAHLRDMEEREATASLGTLGNLTVSNIHLTVCVLVKEFSRPNDPASRVNDFRTILRVLFPQLCCLNHAGFGTSVTLGLSHNAWIGPIRTARALHPGTSYFRLDSSYLEKDLDLVFTPTSWAPEDMELWIEECVPQFNKVR